MKLTKQQEMRAMEAYNAYWENYLKGNVEAMASLLSSKYTQVGSAETEVFSNKKDAVKFLYDTIDQVAGKLEMRNRIIKLEKQSNLLLFHELCDLYALAEHEWIFYSKFRATTIMEEKKHGWKIIHQHSSFPDARTGEGENVAIDKIAEENRELREAVKRRTVELEQKSRELEIEASLEKVRAVAMGMREPADMLDVCKTISLQLHSLGVKEIRNVQTAIFYEHRGTYMNYEYYAKHDKTLITETVFTNNKIHNEFATKMMRGKGETFITHIKGDEVKDWIAYQKTTNVFIDKYLDTASSLNYYWFSLGPVALGISTYHPLTEEEINLFGRFLKVFELAYQRYLDIEQAETQAREAQIEASLERVRAVAMSMNKSDDLLSICEVSFKEFQKLGFDNIRNAIIHIPNDEKGFFMDYDYSEFVGGAITKIEYGSHPIVDDYIKQIRKAEDAFFEVVIKEDQLQGWKDFRKKSGQYDDPRLDDATALYYYLYSIGIGDIGISTFGSIDESQIKILKRFRNVFDLAYRRYSDITLAESQAREAKIEAALEKVRATAMSMMKSDDLLNVCEVLFAEFHKLGFYEMRNAMINIHNDEKETFINYDYSDEIGRSINQLTYNIHPIIEKQIKQIRSANDAFSETSFTGKDLEEWKKFRHQIGEQDDPRINNISALYYYFYSIGTDSIGISTFSPIEEEKLTLIKRFRNVFSLSYQRYSDLALAEAQAREAQIELALERVRARTMAMQGSNELVDTSTVLFHQLKILGIDSIRTGVATMDEVNETVEVWSTSGKSGNFEKKILGVVPIKVHPMFTGIFNSWKNKDPYFAYELKGDELKIYYTTLSSYLSYPEQKVFNEREMIYTFFFPEGSLNVVSRDELSEEDCSLVLRFAKVFGLVYTRFLDLQKAEAQTREAKIEAALERVRSRTMGMQKSEELKEVIRVVYEQFVHLKINIDHAGFIVDYTPKGDWHFWIADQQEIPSKITHPYFDSVWAHQFNEAKEKGIDFFATNLNFEEKNKFYNELLSYVPGLPEVSKDFYLSCPGLAGSTVLLDNVGLYIENFSGIPYSDEENNTLMRFGKVFQQTYTRFLDLQKAEAQAREAKIEAALERVRSKAMAMHTSQDLSETMGVLFTELPKLDINSLRCGVVLLSKNSRQGVFYAAATTSESDSFSMIGSGDMSAHPVFEKQYECWINQENYFVTLSKEELRSYYESLFARLSVPYFPRQHKEQTEHGYYFPFSEGMFYTWDEKPYSEDEINILTRFKAILDLTFRRYLDLQKAESQAREAQIEASLERVRSKAMAMHSPNDLSETVNVFFKELKTLGIIPIRCGVGQIDEATRTTSLTTTTSSQQGESFQVIGKVKQTGHPVLDGIFDHWKLQKEYHPVLEGEDIKAYYNVMNAQIGYPEYPEGVTQYGNNFFFKEGFVFAWTENLLSEEELIIFRRFTSVLSLTYRRYLDLKEAEERNKIIQAENDRKTKELEEARQLQLSMLPKMLPKLSNLDIAVYMKTATEVGGDYYDFNVQANGVLNLGIGDATGHGLQAGTMITLMKGFFTSDVARFSPQKFLEHCNGMIRDIKLGRILMSFSHLRFENSKLFISSAGMPPVYYHHKKNNRTEEIIIQGLPLGAMGSVSYKLVEKQLSCGDTILLLTDGLPEQMNGHNVIFDYSRVLKYFDEIAENASNEIINRLVQKADEWMNGQKQSDDITFVVIKVK